jgi:hypothetical protein
MRLAIFKENKYVIINLNKFNGISVRIKKAHERIKWQGHQLLNAKRDLSKTKAPLSGRSNLVTLSLFKLPYSYLSPRLLPETQP